MPSLSTLESCNDVWRLAFLLPCAAIVMIFLAFQCCWSSLFFSVKPDILALKHYFLSFGIFSLQKCTLSFSCWRYCATFEMMEIWKFSIQSYKSNFTLTLRNIQRGLTYAGQGLVYMYYGTDSYACLSLSYLLNYFLQARIVQNWQLTVLWEWSLECV